MRVRIGEYWLAGDPSKTEREHSSTLIQYQPQRLQQEVTGHRWANKKYIDRENLSWDISFETVRRFDSYALATAFILAYADAHPFSGTVCLRTDTGVATWTEKELKDAVIEMPLFIPEGSNLRLRYTIRGGKLQDGITSATPTVFDLDLEGGGALDQEGGGSIQTEH